MLLGAVLEAKIRSQGVGHDEYPDIAKISGCERRSDVRQDCAFLVSLFWFLIAIALICAIWAARAQQSNTAEAERYIKESESQWAESVANGDASVVERILADDFC